MKKRIIAVVSAVLILALCIGFSACSNDKKDSSGAAETAGKADVKGVALADTFDFSGRTIHVSEICDESDNPFKDAGEAQGKWVAIKFLVDDGDSQFNVSPEGFSVNGKAAVDAQAVYVSGATAKAGSSLRDTKGITFMVLFDVDKDVEKDQLELKVAG